MLPLCGNLLATQVGTVVDPDWILVTTPIKYQPSNYAFHGQYQPDNEPVNWLRATLPVQTWKLVYDQIDITEDESPLPIYWRGDFMGYSFKNSQDAVLFKLTWGGT